MHSDDDPGVKIRPMVADDLPAVSNLVVSAGNFNITEIDCALELVDVYLTNESQKDYIVVIAEDSASVVQAYACWGPVPLTRGAFDLYWIATNPNSRGRGFGRALMNYAENQVLKMEGRLLAVETSSKPSYTDTVKFYRSLGYAEEYRIRDFYDVGDDKLILVKRLS
jgi:ribosomal protein S18 acetylase RimI-like enzyme